MQQPVVSVIVPTTHDRYAFNQQILQDYLHQNYQSKFITFDFNEGMVGEKRNRLCKAAKGDIIIHFDSDDRYAPDWISRSVEVLIKSESDIVGLSAFNLYDKEKNTAWSYDYGKWNLQWVCGASMCYWKSFWEKNNFQDIQIGEDNIFAWGKIDAKPKVLAHNYKDGFLASIHDKNTSPRKLSDISRYAQHTEEEKERLKRLFSIQRQTT